MLEGSVEVPVDRGGDVELERGVLRALTDHVYRAFEGVELTRRMDNLG